MLESPRELAVRVRRSAFVFPLVVAAGLALLVISETSYHRARESMDALGALGQARTSIQALHRLMLDAARNLEFEKAAELRDRLSQLKQQLFGVALPIEP